jgi:hypothetical protein
MVADVSSTLAAAMPPVLAMVMVTTTSLVVGSRASEVVVTKLADGLVLEPVTLMSTDAEVAA